MSFKLFLKILVLLGGIILFQPFCIKDNTIGPKKPCIDDQPVEDTTRIYLMPRSRDTLKIYPKAIFARFYPWVKDTNQIKTIFEKYHLRKEGVFDEIAQQWGAFLFVTDNRRAEYHFTPYGKTGFCNFGSDSLVEYAFGVFNNIRNVPSGGIDFRFIIGTPQAQIDSFFVANGLRFLCTMPDIPSGYWYLTVITPHAVKNVIDLGYELQFIPFVRDCSVGISSGSISFLDE